MTLLAQFPLLLGEHQVPSLLLGERVPVDFQVLVNVEDGFSERVNRCWADFKVSAGTAFVWIHALVTDARVRGELVEAEDAPNAHWGMIAATSGGLP
jgi:hypothetical protein